MEKQPHRACERTKSKQKRNQVTSHSNLTRVLLFDLAHKQSNGIIKGWLHCLTSESIGRFLFNNIWLSMMSGHGANPIFFSKKKEIGHPEHSLIPPSTPSTTATPSPPLLIPTSDNILFLPSPLLPAPLKAK